MNDNLQQLQDILRLLALPVIGQVRLVPDGCVRIDVLVEAFDAACLPAYAELDASLTAAQKAILTRLGKQLAQVRSEVTSPLCSELALRRSREWQQVRRQARSALVQFQWPLEAPPLGILSHDRYS
jgi:hypothetical protein